MIFELMPEEELWGSLRIGECLLLSAPLALLYISRFLTTYFDPATPPPSIGLLDDSRELACELEWSWFKWYYCSELGLAAPGFYTFNPSYFKLASFFMPNEFGCFWAPFPPYPLTWFEFGIPDLWRFPLFELLATPFLVFSIFRRLVFELVFLLETYYLFML
jgi:hypothetical protein